MIIFSPLFRSFSIYVLLHCMTFWGDFIRELKQRTGLLFAAYKVVGLELETFSMRMNVPLPQASRKPDLFIFLPSDVSPVARMEVT
jgi:hypothetical protein